MWESILSFFAKPEVLEYAKYVGTLMLLQTGNTTLGLACAHQSATFDKKKLLSGIKKSALVMASMSTVFMAGQIMGDAIVIDINGSSMSIVAALSVLLYGSVTMYSVDIITKLFKIFKQDKPILTQEPEPVIMADDITGENL